MGDKLKHRRWYAFLSGNPMVTESYQIATETPRCSNGRILCAIYARGYDEQPEELSTEMKIYIANALITGASQPIGSITPVVVLR